MKMRLTLAATAVFALGGALAPIHAEETTEAAAAPVVADEALPKFEPSAEAFDTAFAGFEPGEVVAPQHAVDIDAIEPADEPVEQDLGTGVASYYGKRFAGRPTASGERFDPQQYTAAHRTLPFGSKVRVTNPNTGKSVVVRINDRGPFVKGRTIDVSRRAAEDLGLVRAGHGTVELDLLRS